MRKIAFILLTAVVAVALCPQPAAAVARSGSTVSAGAPAGSSAVAAADPLDRLLDWLSGWFHVMPAGSSSGGADASGSAEPPPSGENGPVLDPNGVAADTGD